MKAQDKMTLHFIFDEEFQPTSTYAFAEGAEWRINSVWHDKKEEPKQSEWFIAQIGNDCFDTFVMQVESERWGKWCKGLNIKRWAYVKDLLPTKTY